MIQLRYCAIEWTDAGCVTRFPGWPQVFGQPHDTPHYHVIAHRCGYGDDLLAYSREHEFAHSFVAERLFDQASHVLMCLARGHPVVEGFGTYEEIAAQAFQRWLRANERPIIADVDWDGLKADALRLLDGAAA